MPAHERLDAGDAPRLQVHLRLVVERELARRERAADLAEQLQPSGVRALHARRVDLDPRRRGSGRGRARGRRAAAARRRRRRARRGPPRRRSPPRRGRPRSSATGGSSARSASSARSRASALVAPRRAQHRVLVAAEACRERRPRSAGRRRRATSRSTSSPLSAPSVLLIALKRSRSISSTARVAAARRGARRASDLFDEQRPVRQPGQRVVAREPVVLRRLAAQTPRGPRHDPVEHRPQQRQPDREQQRDHALVALHGGGDRPVAEVDLERARRPARRR